MVSGFIHLDRGVSFNPLELMPLVADRFTHLPNPLGLAHRAFGAYGRQSKIRRSWGILGFFLWGGESVHHSISLVGGGGGGVA